MSYMLQESVLVIIAAGLLCSFNEKLPGKQRGQSQSDLPHNVTNFEGLGSKHSCQCKCKKNKDLKLPDGAAK